MNFEPHQIYHVYNRGNNRQRIFYSRDHYFMFIMKMRKILIPHCEILAYCLMPNHYHLMIYPREFVPEKVFTISYKKEIFYHPLVRKIGTIQSSYARKLNNELQMTGSIFQQKAKSKLLNGEADYPLICFHYIHQNPIRSALVQSLDQWEFSSYFDYAGYRNDDLVNKDLAKIFIDISSDPLVFRQESEKFLIRDIRGILPERKVSSTN